MTPEVKQEYTQLCKWVNSNRVYSKAFVQSLRFSKPTGSAAQNIADTIVNDWARIANRALHYTPLSTLDKLIMDLMKKLR